MAKATQTRTVRMTIRDLDEPEILVIKNALTAFRTIETTLPADRAIAEELLTTMNGA